MHTEDLFTRMCGGWGGGIGYTPPTEVCVVLHKPGNVQHTSQVGFPTRCQLALGCGCQEHTYGLLQHSCAYMYAACAYFLVLASS